MRRMNAPNTEVSIEFLQKLSSYVPSPYLDPHAYGRAGKSHAMMKFVDHVILATKLKL